jgi:hypothetical protein
MKTSFRLLLPLLLMPFAAFTQSSAEKAVTLAKSINTDQFFEQMNIISSDSMQGRETGSRGYNKAADYIVGNIEKLGLKPGGINGTYFQPVPYEKRKIDESSVIFSVNTKDQSIPGVFGSDITIFPSIKSSEVKMDGTLVFAGYGLEIPELSINDFQGIDVKDKIVVITMDSPTKIDRKKYSTYLNPIDRIQSIEKKGAKGLILFTNRNMLQNLIFKAFHGFFKEPYFDFQETDISNTLIGNGKDLLAFSKKEFIERIFTQNGLKYKKTIKNLKKGNTVSKELNSSLHLQYSLIRENISCKNIVAILPGSDPELSSEYVILSAHLDHLGIGKAVKNDSIYNGAWDNASGCATLLSVAETYKKLPEAPKRSVIFLWVTGEEKGLLGSHYFADKPTVQKDKIISDMSLDMAGGLFEARDILPMGYKMSNLSQAVNFATNALSLVSDTSSALENEYFERSDHFSFVSADIPALLIFGGMNAVDPKIDGMKVYKTWEKKIYHHPSDDMKQNFSKTPFLQGIQVNFLVSWFIANEMKEVSWKKDSEQYKRYLLK